MSFKGFVKYPIGNNLGSWFNQASSTFTQIGNKYNLYVPKPVSGDNITGRYVAPPSTPYTVITHINVNPTDTTALNYGGGLGFGDGTKTIFMSARHQSNTYTSSWLVAYCATSTSITSLAGYSFNYGFPWITNGWMAIRNDGTNIIFYSGDESGKNFYQVYSEAKGDHLGTINEIGIYTDSVSSATNVTIDSFQVIGV